MKIGNLYNLDSYKSFLDSGNKVSFADAYAGTVLTRNLEAIDPKIFEKKYPDLAFITSGIQADNSGGYAELIKSLRVQSLGGFNTVSDIGSNKGKISLAGEASFLNVIEREAESSWSDTEIKQNEIQGINLMSKYIESHNLVYMREVDVIGLVGVGTKTGLLNTAAFTSGAAAGAVGTLTAAEMYAEVADLIQTQRNGVNNTLEYSANSVVMPVDVLNKLQATIMNSAAGSSSVLKTLKDNFPDVNFFATPRAASVSGTSRTVAFSNNSEAMVMRIPMPLTVGDIIKEGSFNYKFDSKYRIAGLDVLEASAGYILTGL